MKPPQPPAHTESLSCETLELGQNAAASSRRLDHQLPATLFDVVRLARLDQPVHRTTPGDGPIEFPEPDLTTLNGGTSHVNGSVLI